MKCKPWMRHIQPPKVQCFGSQCALHGVPALEYVRHFSTFSRRAQNVKKCPKYFRHFSTIFAQHEFSGPWGGGGSDESTVTAFVFGTSWAGRLQTRKKTLKNWNENVFFWAPPLVRSEKQPKHKVFGRDIPGTSGTQTSGYPGQKLYASGLFCCFRQGVAGMSRDLGRDVPDLEKLYARRLWADLSYPI